MRRLSVFIILCLIVSCMTKEKEEPRYSYSRWTLSNPTSQIKPRGGTSTGPSTEKAEVHKGWQKLKNSSAKGKARDRAAILAMVGTYKASFEFLETYGFTKDYELDRPYQSWGTEYVFPVEEKEDFISLQHVMVMYFLKDDKVVGPYVMKHWRQDWVYEARDLDEFLGDGKYVRKSVKKSVAKGTWVQKVYQVDDSPRYQARGKWQHESDFSVWLSEASARPLPRREYSVRKDYKLLLTTHRITILHSGWFHEQDSMKISINRSSKRQILAKEIGINQYQALKNFDISEGQKYWEKTNKFWKQVRLAWQDVEKKYSSYNVVPKKDAQVMFMKMFELADKADSMSVKECRDKAREVVRFHITDLVKVK